MATLILVRHGRTSANASGILAGRTPGVRLDEVGQQQVQVTADRISAVSLSAIVSSPLERCRETAQAIAASQLQRLRVRTDKAITECGYGEWQGRKLAELAKEPLWQVVQKQPSAAVFPGGESLVAMASRAVSGVRRLDADLEASHGPQAVWVAVSHGDIIKAVLADALGSHLDHFQRIHVDPASVSVIRYTEARPYVVATNTRAGDLSWLNAPPPPAEDAAVGGGAGRP